MGYFAIFLTSTFEETSEYLLKVSSPSLISKINDWTASDEETHSEHKSVKFTIQYDNICCGRHRLEGKRGKHAKFDKNVRKIRNKYIIKLQKAKTIDQLDIIKLQLQNELTAIACWCYKHKNLLQFRRHHSGLTKLKWLEITSGPLGVYSKNNKTKSLKWNNAYDINKNELNSRN